MKKETDINWDTTDENGKHEIDLPKEVRIPKGITDDDIADYLSDEYGWCVNSFNIVVTK